MLGVLRRKWVFVVSASRYKIKLFGFIKQLFQYLQTMLSAKVWIGARNEGFRLQSASRWLYLVCFCCSFFFFFPSLSISLSSIFITRLKSRVSWPKKIWSCSYLSHRPRVKLYSLFGRPFQPCATSDICDCDWFLERSIATFPPPLSLSEFFSVLWTVRSGFARNCTQTVSTFLSVLHEAKYVQQVRYSQTQGIHRLIIHTHTHRHTRK